MRPLSSAKIAEYVRFELNGEVACSWCWASTDKAQGVAWHEDECIWRHLVETVKGTPSV